MSLSPFPSNSDSPDADLRIALLDPLGRFVVVDKPAGMLSVPGKDRGNGENQDCVPARLPRLVHDASGGRVTATGPLIVHRLDMDTSGLMVLGLDADAQRELSIQFEKRTVSKAYTAVVLHREDGSGLPAERGEIDAPMRPDLDNRPMQIIDALPLPDGRGGHGRPARTLWTLLAVEPDRSRVELVPITGRTHQLRLHMAHIGFPIAGDVLYGPQPRTREAAERLLLHASMLEFSHPQTGERVCVHSRCPF